MNLRPYQQAAVDTTLAELETKRSSLIVLPTGTGKTIVFSHIIKAFSSRGRALVIAHREELIHQAADKIRAVTGQEPDIEMADAHADRHMFRRSGVVVASVQTLLSDKRLGKFRPEDFTLIVTDEAHHATANSYRRIYDYFAANPRCQHVGVTATPDRADEEALGQIYDSVGYVYEIVDAIHDGWLVPILQRSVVVESMDFSQIRTTAGDLNGGDLAQVMEYERNLHEVASPTLELAKWRKVLVFAASVAHAERLCEIFNRHRPRSAHWISGETPRDVRKERLGAYAAGDFQFLVNVGVFTEGFDEPTIDMVVLARPTKSRALFSQMIGRGTRPLPGIVDGLPYADARREAIDQSEKPNVEVLDFVGNTGRHKLITVADILGGNVSDEVVDRTIDQVKQANEPIDVLARFEKVKKDIEAERERERLERKKLVASTKFQTQAVDPFDILDIDAPVQRGWDKQHPMTDNQKAFLEKAGVPLDGLNRKTAGALIGSIIDRRKNNQATFKQAKILAKYGYDTRVSFDQASQIIDGLARNGWRKPKEVPA